MSPYSSEKFQERMISDSLWIAAVARQPGARFEVDPLYVCESEEQVTTKANE
jgi:hypothetical protein